VLPLKDNVPTRHFPFITVAFIAINIVVFGWQLSFPSDRASTPELAQLGISERDENSIEYGAIPKEITDPGSHCIPAVSESGQGSCGSREDSERIGIHQAPWWLTILTSMFMHGGILHIAGNMLFLWVFGNNIEDSMGRLRFIAFYLLGGVAALYSQALIDPGATVPTIGASGAVAGVLGGYALLLPQARVLTLVFIVFFVTLIEIPALFLLGVWFVLQFLPAVGQVATPELGGGGGVAYFAHVGGFVFGLLLIRLFATHRPEIAPRYPVY
jgi:membrane associated rhomboid family serine protease